MPKINDADQLREAIDFCCYPPRGKRGVGFSRANLFGDGFNEQLLEENLPLVIAMIEDIKAVHNLEDILDVSGLDAIFIGPYDLSSSMQITGQFKNELLVETLN